MIMTELILLAVTAVLFIDVCTLITEDRDEIQGNTLG